MEGKKQKQNYLETYKHAAGERHDGQGRLVGGQRPGREARYYRYCRRYRCCRDFMRGDKVSAALGADKKQRRERDAQRMRGSKGQRYRRKMMWLWLFWRCVVPGLSCGAVDVWLS